MAIKNSEFRIQNFISGIKKLKPVIFFVILYFVFLVFFSCSYKKETPPPPDLIDENKMALVISDVSIVESVLNTEPLSAFNDTLKKINVFKEHHVSNQQFLISLKYYSENPLKLKSIYAEVAGILQKKLGLPADTSAKK